AVRAHAQCVAHELALRDMAHAFDIGRARFHLHDMRLLQAQLDRVFDRDHPFVAVDVLRDRVQQRCLAGAGAARDQYIEPRARGDLQYAGDFPRQVLLPHHRVERQAALREFADRDRAAVEHERRQYDVDTAAIGEPGVDHWAGLVDTPADRTGDALRDVDEMLGIAKSGGGFFELAVPLDIDAERPVRQDIGDLVIIEEWLERPEAGHVVGQLSGERALLDLVELDPLLGGDLADQLRYLGPQGLARDTSGDGRIDPRHQCRSDLFLELTAAGKICR